MLDTALGMLRMLLYVIRLLHLSKSGLSSLPPDASTTRDSSSNSTGSSSKRGHHKSLAALAAAGAVGIGYNHQQPVTLKDNIKRSVLKLWEDTQQVCVLKCFREGVEL